MRIMAVRYENKTKTFFEYKKSPIILWIIPQNYGACMRNGKTLILPVFGIPQLVRGKSYHLGRQHNNVVIHNEETNLQT